MNYSTKAGCPCWTYDFKKDCGKCAVSGELEPDEGADKLFRCDFEYFNCPHYSRRTIFSI